MSLLGPISTLRRWRDESYNADFLAGIPTDYVHTRAGASTYWDADGVLRTAAANVPCIQYDPITRKPRGLLLQRQVTNKYANTKDPTWDMWPAQANTTDPKFPGIKVVRVTGVTPAGATMTWGRVLALTPTNPTVTHRGVFIKPFGGVRYVSVWGFTSVPSHGYCSVADLKTCTILVPGLYNTAQFVKDVGDGWYYIAFDLPINESYRSLTVGFGMDGIVATNFANWTPLSPSQGALLAAPICNNAAGFSMPVITDGVEVTRPRDYGRIAVGSYFSSAIGGALLAEFDIDYIGSTLALPVVLSDGSAANQMGFYLHPAGTIGGIVVAAGTTVHQASAPGVVSTAGGRLCAGIACNVAAGTIMPYANGVATVPKTGVTSFPAGIDTMEFNASTGKFDLVIRLARIHSTFPNIGMLTTR